MLFKDLVDDWNEIIAELGVPHIVNAADFSYTQRRRVYWTNMELPSDFDVHRDPKRDPNADCMDKCRTVELPVKTSTGHCVRTINSSWSGDPAAQIITPVRL